MTAPQLSDRFAAPASLPIAAAAAERRQRRGALLVDIRPQVARHQGSITGALVLDTHGISERFNMQGAQRVTGMHRDREIIVCHISSRRAIPAAEQLSRLGYRHVYYLAGGYTAWRNRHAIT